MGGRLERRVMQCLGSESAPFRDHYFAAPLLRSRKLLSDCETDRRSKSKAVSQFERNTTTCSTRSREQRMHLRRTQPAAISTSLLAPPPPPADPLHTALCPKRSEPASTLVPRPPFLRDALKPTPAAALRPTPLTHRATELLLRPTTAIIPTKRWSRATAAAEAAWTLGEHPGSSAAGADWRRQHKTRPWSQSAILATVHNAGSGAGGLGCMHLREFNTHLFSPLIKTASSSPTSCCS